MPQIFMGRDYPERYGLQPDGEALPPNQSNPHSHDGTVENPSLKPNPKEG